MNRIGACILTAFAAALYAAAPAAGQSCPSEPVPCTVNGVQHDLDPYTEFPTLGGASDCWKVGQDGTTWTPAIDRALIRNEADVEERRNRVIAALWGSGGFPQRSDVTNLEIGVTACLTDPNADSTGTYCYPYGIPSTDTTYPRPTNLARVDRFRVLTPITTNTTCNFVARTSTNQPAISSVVYFFHPARSNGRLALFVQGHDFLAYRAGGATTISTLLAQGFSVLSFWMPLMGENERCHTATDPNNYDHTQLESTPVAQGNSLSAFVEPMAVAINYAIENAGTFQLNTPVDISMFGISGGGWTTTAYAALDPRVRRSFSASGSLPTYVRMNSGNSTIPGCGVHFELLRTNAIHSIANTEELYVMAGSGTGRKHLQLFNQTDSCCHFGIGYRTYWPTLRDLVSDRSAFPAGGEYQAFLEKNGGNHEVSTLSAQSIAYPDLFPPLILPRLDFNGDGRTERAIYRASDGSWAAAGATIAPVSGSRAGDQPVPADYDGDGKSDAALYRPATGAWYIQGSTAGALSFTSPTDLPGGAALDGDIPVPGNYTNDGVSRADRAIFRPANGTWYVRGTTSLTVTPATAPWGAFRSGDIPVPADYDGDGKTDMAIFRPNDGGWYIRRSSDGAAQIVRDPRIVPGDLPVPADYDGDGITDRAFFRPAELDGSGSSWYIERSRDGQQVVKWAASPGDRPIPGRYEPGSQRDVPALYRPSDGSWQILYSTGGVAITAVPASAEASDAPLGTRTNRAYAVVPVTYASSTSQFAPTGVRAAATAANSAVDITWNAVSGASEYQVFRSSAGAPFARIGATVTITGHSYTDSTVATGQTYLYRVKSVSGGTASAFSNVDLATTFSFTDDNALAGKNVSAAYLTELRDAVNLVLAAGGLAPVTLPPFSGADMFATAAHLQTLREALSRAYAAIGMPLPPVFRPATLMPKVATVTAASIQEIRDAVK